MAVAIRECLGVDIGTQHIRVAQMELGKAGPRVSALVEQRLELEPGLSDTQRSQRVAQQVQELLRRARIRTKNAVFCVPGLSVFTRKFPLPKAAPEQLARMIRFEARQQIPFPLEKTIMEYQVFEQPDANEVQVLLVAIKREFIVNFMRLVQRTGLRPIAISTTTLAVYNFHELNSSKQDLSPVKKRPAKAPKPQAGGGMFKRKKGAAAEAEAAVALAEAGEEPLEDMGFEEIQACVNIGASLMDIAIPKPGLPRMLGFPRSVPLAGNVMDQAIRERLNIDDPERLRRIKETQTAILSGDFEVSVEADSYNMEASAAATAAADRIISEIRRTLDYYISQPDGVAVDSIILSGGLARVPFLAGYIEEKMGLPVQVALPRNAQVRMPDPLPDPFCTFVIAIGLAAQGLRLSRNQINFLPEEVKSIRSFQERRYEALGAVAMLALLVGLSWNIGNSRMSFYNMDAARYRERINSLKEDDKAIRQAISRNDKVSSAFEQLAKTAGKAPWRRDYWLFFLTKFQERKPPQILIDQIDMRRDGNVIVRGRAERETHVYKFVDDLQDKTTDPVMGVLVWKAEIAQIDVNPVFDRRFNAEVYRFQLLIKTLVRKGRSRELGQAPSMPTPTPPPTPTPGPVTYPGGFRAPGFIR